MVILLIFLLTSGVVRPMDAVDINIWRHPDLSGRFIISSDTTVSLPLIGIIDCRGHNQAEVESIIIGGYAKYLLDPYVDVKFLFPVRILGEVNHPGVYYLEPGQGVADLLAQCGGFNNESNGRGAQLIRDGKSRKVNLIGVLEGKDRLELQSNDLIIVPRSFWASLQKWGILISAATLIITAYNAISK
ncbi:MAG TPA: polysaccharide export protein [bacterium (Candidatus Stahlbacteria)]|nr:polysaccharide export protein [Candidatus Stahlbacteria bacterium]